MKYFLGIDNGGTTTKASIFTQDGKEMGMALAATKMLAVKPNFAERDMDEMWETNCNVILEAIEKSGVDPKEISGISCCGHGKGLYLWGHDNRPVRNGIISADNRAYRYPQAWEKNGVAEKVFEKSLQKILACQPVSLLAWLKDNEPDAIKKTKWVFECKDYVRFRLTGEPMGEITDYSGANLVNLNSHQYDLELLEMFGLGEIIDKLPPLCKSTDICGYVTKEAAEKTGLLEGTPVAGGMFDIDACAIAVDAAHEDRVCMIAGTWSINQYIRRDPVKDGTVSLNSLFCIPGYYLIEESSATSAGNNEWFINTMLPELKEKLADSDMSIYDEIDECVESISVEEVCPIFTPFLMASNTHPKAKASLVGMNNYHTRAHLMRSIYEGIAFSHKYHFEKLLKTIPSNITSIQLAGGVAKSRVWSQMFADVMGYPVSVIDINEAGALGCAMSAAVAVGIYKDYFEAAEYMVHPLETLEPDKYAHSAYNNKYMLYQEVINDLDTLWEKM